MIELDHKLSSGSGAAPSNSDPRDARDLPAAHVSKYRDTQIHALIKTSRDNTARSGMLPRDVFQHQHSVVMSAAQLASVINASDDTRTRLRTVVTDFKTEKTMKAAATDFSRVGHDVLEDAVTILRHKAVQNRTHEDVKHLMTVMRTNNFFRDLPGDICRSVCRELHWVCLADREVLFCEGDIADAAYIILRGRVGWYRESSNACVATLGEGDCFGEWALIHDARHASTIRALEVTELLAIDKTSYLTLLRDARLDIVRKQLLVDILTHSKTRERTRADVIMLRDIMKGIKEFECLPEDKVEEVCQLMDLETASENSPLYEKDDTPKYWYYLASGVVCIERGASIEDGKNEKSDSDRSASSPLPGKDGKRATMNATEVTGKTNQMPRSSMAMPRSSMAMPRSSMAMLGTNEERISILRGQSCCVSNLLKPSSPIPPIQNLLFHIYVEGNMFGEWELSRDTTRAFTAVAYTYCTLVRVPRSSYFRVFRNLRRQASLISYCTTVLENVAVEQRTPNDLSALHDMIRGLKKFQVLDHTTTQHLSKQISCITREKDHILFDEGDEGDSFYLILRGTVGIYKRIDDTQVFKTSDTPQRSTQSYVMHVKGWEGPFVNTADKMTFARRRARYQLALYVYAKDLNIPHTTNEQAVYSYTHEDLLRDVDEENPSAEDIAVAEDDCRQTGDGTSLLERIRCSVLFKKPSKQQESSARISANEPLNDSQQLSFLPSGVAEASSNILPARPSHARAYRRPDEYGVSEANSFQAAAAEASEQGDRAEAVEEAPFGSGLGSPININAAHPNRFNSVSKARATHGSSWGSGDAAGRISHLPQSAIVDRRTLRISNFGGDTRDVTACLSTVPDVIWETGGCPAGYSTIFNSAPRRDKRGSRKAQRENAALRAKGKRLACLDACLFRQRRCSSAPPPLASVAAAFERPYIFATRHEAASDGEELLERDLMGVNTESDDSGEDNGCGSNLFNIGRVRAEKIAEVGWMATQIRSHQASFRVSYYKTELAVHDPAPPNAARLLTLRMAIKGHLARNKVKRATESGGISSPSSPRALLFTSGDGTALSFSSHRTKLTNGLSCISDMLGDGHENKESDAVGALTSRTSAALSTKIYDRRRTFIQTVSIDRPTRCFLNTGAGRRSKQKAERHTMISAFTLPQAEEPPELQQREQQQPVVDPSVEPGHDVQFFAAHKLLLEMGAGEAFGEWALLRNERRAATVRLLTDCDLLTISKATYDEVVREKLTGKLDMKKCTRALRKIPSQRTDSDLDVLDSLIRGNEFFMCLNVRPRRELCKHMVYHSLSPDEILFRQGEMADAFYLVLLGKVGVYMAAQGEATDGTQVMSGNEQLVATVYEGSTFGEWGLQQDMPRTATIKAFCRCDLVMIDKLTYERVLKEYRQHLWKLDAATQIVKATNPTERSEDQVRHLCQLVKGQPFFDRLPNVILNECCQRFQYVNRAAHHILYRKGDPPDAMYILLKGDVVVEVVQKGRVDRLMQDTQDATTDIKTKSQDATEKKRVNKVAVLSSELLGFHAPLWCAVNKRLAVFADDLVSEQQKPGNQLRSEVVPPLAAGPTPFGNQFALAIDKVEQGIHARNIKTHSDAAKQKKNAKKKNTEVIFTDEDKGLAAGDTEAARSINDEQKDCKSLRKIEKTVRALLRKKALRATGAHDADDQSSEETPHQIREGDILGEFGAQANEKRQHTLKTTTPCELLLLGRDTFQTVLREEMLKEQAEQIRVLSTLIRPTPPISNTEGTSAPPAARSRANALAEQVEEGGVEEDPAVMLARLSLYFRLENYTKGATVVMADWRSTRRAESMIEYMGPVNVRYDGRADSERLYIMSEGTCEVEHRGKVLDILLPGQILNGCSLLLQKPEPFQITVSSPEAHFLSITHADLSYRCPEHVVSQLHRLAATQDSLRQCLKDSPVDRAVLLALRDACGTPAHVDAADDAGLDLIHSPFLRHKTCGAAAVRHGKRVRAMFERIKLFQLAFDDYMPPEMYTPRNYFIRMYKHAQSFLNIRFTPYPQCHEDRDEITDAINDGPDGDGVFDDSAGRLRRPRRRTITRGTTYSDPIRGGESAWDRANRCFLRAKDVVDAPAEDEQQTRAVLPAIPHHLPHALRRVDGDAVEERSPSRTADVAMPRQLVSYLRTQAFEFGDVTADDTTTRAEKEERMEKMERTEEVDVGTLEEAKQGIHVRSKATKSNTNIVPSSPTVAKESCDEHRGLAVAFRARPHDVSPSLPGSVIVRKCALMDLSSNGFTTDASAFPLTEQRAKWRPVPPPERRAEWRSDPEQCTENARHAMHTGGPGGAVSRGRSVHWPHRGRKVTHSRVEAVAGWDWNGAKRQGATPRWRSCLAGNARGNGSVDDWATLFSAMDADWGALFTTT